MKLALTNNSPTGTIPKADDEPGSPTSPGYASSDHDHASAGSGIFSRTSSGTSHSSHLDDPTTEDAVAWQDSSPLGGGANASSGDLDTSTLGANSPSGEGAAGVGADKLSALLGFHPSGASPLPPLPPRPPTPPQAPIPPSPPALIVDQRLQMLRNRGVAIPEYVEALREDLAVDMLYHTTDLQKKIEALREDLSRHPKNVVVVDEQVKTTSSAVDVEALVKQAFDASAKHFQGSFDESAKALEQRLDASNEKRLAVFKEEISDSVAEQIRVELGTEQTTNEDTVVGTLALQAYAEDVAAESYNTILQEVQELCVVVNEIRRQFPPLAAPVPALGPAPAPASAASSAIGIPLAPSFAATSATRGPAPTPSSTTSSASASAASASASSATPTGDRTAAHEVSHMQDMLRPLSGEVVRIGTRIKKELAKCK